MTKHTNETLKDTFITGLPAIFKIAGYKRTFFSSWMSRLPLLFSFLGLLLFYLLNIDFYEGLIELKSIMIDFLPGILGFTVAGYALMVGFIHGDMIDKITEPSRDTTFSLYQKMSATFAINVMLQAIALLIAFAIHFIVFLDSKKAVLFEIPSTIAVIVNVGGFLILSYWFLISLFMVIQIILNIFSFSQLHHYFINKTKVDQKNEQQ